MFANYGGGKKAVIQW